MKRMTWDKEEEIRSNVIIIEWIVQHGRSCAVMRSCYPQIDT